MNYPLNVNNPKNHKQIIEESQKQKQSKQPTDGLFQTKKYVRGAFLYSTEQGSGFQDKNKNRIQDQILIQDKGNVGSLKREIMQKKQQLIKKKQKTKKQKHMLIPIRDTPVQPLPQPMLENNKCQRATQQQFEYFQTYISQKQKERKLEQQQRRRIQIFEYQQQRFRKNQQNQQRKGITIVLQKQQNPILFNSTKNSANNQVKKKPHIKVVIKKKQTQKSQNKEIVNQISAINKVINKDLEDKQQKNELNLTERNNLQNDEELDQQSKVRIIQGIQWSPNILYNFNLVVYHSTDYYIN